MHWQSRCPYLYNRGPPQLRRKADPRLAIRHYDKLSSCMDYSGLQCAHAGNNCGLPLSDGIGPSQHERSASVGYQFVSLGQQKSDGLYRTCMGIKNEVFLLVNIP